jgi:hypothetical protein
LGIKPIHDLGFRPVKERLYFIDNKMFFNCYQGNKYLNFNKTDIPKDKLNINIEKQCPNIYLLLRNLTGYNDEAFKYINKYLSFILQNPSLRTQKVISFYGDEATGKGIFYEYILNCLFENYVSYIGMEDMESGFNSYYSKKLFVFIDESRYNKQIEQHMLRMTTAKTAIINHKNGKKEEEEIHFNYICASNKDIPMKVGARRSIYFRSETLGGNPDKAKEIGKTLVENIPKEIENYFYYLLNMNITFEDINKGIENDEKFLIEEATRDIKDIFVDTLRSFQDLEKFINYVNKKSQTNINIENYLQRSEGTTFVEMALLFDLYNSFLKSEGWKTTYAHNKMGFLYHKLKIDREKEINKNLFNREGRRVQFIDVQILSAKIGFDKPIVQYYHEAISKKEITINTKDKTPTLFYQIRDAFNKCKELTLQQIQENFESVKVEELLINVNKLKQEGFIFEPRNDLFKLVGN